MERALHLFVQILARYDCAATLPLTAITLERNCNLIAQYLDQDIEFAVHGYTHMDYAQLEPDEVLTHVQRACDVFARAGIGAVGFRSAYLSCNPSLYSAVEAMRCSYASNRSILWDFPEMRRLKPSTRAGYEHAPEFRDRWDASHRPSLPQLFGKIVEIPVSLPDDIMLLDRLGSNPHGLVEMAWVRLLSQVHKRGELLTIQLHPERITWCANGLSAVLAQARALAPQVWISRLDEISNSWRARAGAAVQTTDLNDGGFRVVVAGPDGIAVLVRALDVNGPTVTWADGYRQALGTSLTVRASCRPFVGVSTRASPKLAGFLRQQDYVIEVSEERHRYAYYLDDTEFTAEQELFLLARIDKAGCPPVRLGRWPNAARSALAVTGDIDSLTFWDFGLRLFGR
ncbi:polysaccharide deacetylase family protein [Chloroflexota bacterium]